MRQITAQEKYRAVKEGVLTEGEFVRQMRLAFPQFLSPMSTYPDTVQILKNYDLINEGKEAKQAEELSKYSDDSLRRSIDIELEAMGLMSQETISGEDHAKAKLKAIKNLKKDPLHYYNLIAGESSKVDKNDKPKETKRGALEKDTFNDMKKATLKERKQRLAEGTRALVGYLSGDRLTTTYNHYDGYPSHLGAGLQAHYNNDEKAKEVAMKGYISYMNKETGEIEAANKEAPGKVILPDDKEQRAREIAEEIDKFGADYGYVWDDNTNQWIVIKNTGIGSMIDQILEKLDMVNVYSGETMEDIDPSLDPYEDRKEIIKQVIVLLKTKRGASNETVKDFIKMHYEDILNQRDDDGILDEFDQFLSVNTDYIDEAGKETNFDPKEIKSVSFPNGLSVTVGEPHPEEEGIVNFIFKGQNGYEIGFMDGSEGGSYAVDFNGEFLDEDDYIEEAETLDTTAAYKSDDDTQDMIDKMRKDGKDADDFVDEKKVQENTYDVYDDGDVVIDLSNATPEQERLIRWEADPDNGISEFGGSEDAQEFADQIMQLNSVEDVESYYENVRGWGGDSDLSGMIRHAIDAYRGLNEKKGKDHDGDGDVDGDDYMASKDKAIKKAMGKDEAIRESLKAIITKVLEEDQINEAATNVLAAFGDDYAGFDGMKSAINALENIVTDIEQYYDKTRTKIQKVYDTLGEIRNEEGLKVGGFLAPAVEQAFNRDLRPVIKQGFTKGLDQPQVKKLASPGMAQETEAPKQTVFGLNEKKK